MHIDESQITYSVTNIEDPDILSVLPNEYQSLLSMVNGFILKGGWFHVRGAVENPYWHSIREAFLGPRAIHKIFRSVIHGDIPFGQDSLGNQYLLRESNIFYLNGEKGTIDPIDIPFTDFIEGLFRNPEQFISIDHVRHFQARGGGLEPSELLNAYPPIMVYPPEERLRVSLHPVNVDDQLDFLSKLSSSVVRDEVMIPERPIAARDLALRRLSGVIEFDPPIEEFTSIVNSNHTTILSGPNNSGKTLILKCLKAQIGSRAYFLAMDRFYHVYHISTGLRDASQVFNLNRQFIQAFSQETQNTEKNLIDLNQVLIGLDNWQRSKLFSLASQLIGNSFVLKKVDENNDFSPSYIDMDGQNVALGSTGTRLLMTLIGLCLDDRFSCLLVDEPELGLDPRIQIALSDFLFEIDTRKEHFPHLRQIVIATHSHLFLDRSNLSNNYFISKDKNKISMRRVQNVGDFHRLQFNQLGNSLEAMFFPSSIVIVEGKTDYKYFDRLFHIYFPDLRVTILNSNGDVKRKVHQLKEAFGDLRKNPYRERLIIVLDRSHTPSLPDALINQGVKEDNIVIWSKNGIEYFYPQSILANLFSCSEDQVDKMKIEGDTITINELSYSKEDLCNEVIAAITADDDLPDELFDNLFTLLTNITS